MILVAQNRSGGDWGAPVDAVFVRSVDGGRTWSGPRSLVPETTAQRDRFIWKPTGLVADRLRGGVLVFVSRTSLRTREVKPAGERWLYTHIREARALGRGWFLVTSTDEGKIWTPPREITDSLVVRREWQEWSPVHKGIQLRSGPHAGRLVVPVRCHCPGTAAGELDWKYQYDGVIYSDDRGKTWGPGGRSGPSLGECALVERSDGVLYVNHRTSRVPERRAERMMSLSFDGGVTWRPGRVVEEGPAAYSDLVVTSDGTVPCVYETGEKRSRKDLACARFNLAWIRGRIRSSGSALGGTALRGTGKREEGAGGTLK